MQAISLLSGLWLPSIRKEFFVYKHKNPKNCESNQFYIYWFFLHEISCFKFHLFFWKSCYIYALWNLYSVKICICFGNWAKRSLGLCSQEGRNISLVRIFSKYFSWFHRKTILSILQSKFKIFGYLGLIFLPSTLCSFTVSSFEIVNGKVVKEEKVGDIRRWGSKI